MGTDGLLDAGLLNALVWPAGVNSIIIGSGHLTFPDPIAESIDWPTGNPFQWEAGLAIFSLGAAVGHVKEMVVRRNLASGNAGFIFGYDIVAPVLVIALYVAT